MATEIKQSNFQPSISIRFDLGKDEFINRFIPTASHVVPFKGILDGVIGKGQKSHIIAGPYGSGKSLMGVVLAGLCSKGLDQAAVLHLSKKFQLVDGSISNLINEVAAANITYIPVILEGNIHNINRALISSIYKSVKNHGVTVNMPNLITEIIETVQRWANEYPNTYSQFIEKLNQHNHKLDSWIKLIENYNEDAISWFTDIYPLLTSGSQFVPKYSGELVSQINYILGELSKLGKGLFLVHDEFGRFLQSLNSQEVHGAMQDLQDLAELANHNDNGNFNLLLISHKNMRQYAHRLSEDLQKEFQRIEKRFSVYHVESDQSTFVRVSNHTTQSMRDSWSVNEHEKFLQDGIMRYDFFPELTHNEKKSLVVAGGFPLHPVTLFAMPKLANIVAQNERTLFTFLQSNEVGGLRHHFDKNRTWYTPDQLFDYFEPSFDEFEYESNVKQSYLLYKRLQKRLIPSDQLEDQLKIIKLLSLWDMVGLNSRVVLDKGLLSYCLMLDIEYVQIVLDALYRAKIIRYLNDDGRFILYEGSIVDVSKEIEKGIASSTFSVRQKLSVAEQFLENKFYLPKNYNDMKSITRFATVTLVSDTELHDEFLGNHFDNVADLNIVFVVSNSIPEEIQKHVRDLSKSYDKVIFVTSSHTMNNLYRDLEKILVIEKLQQDNVFLSQDRFLMDELNYLKRSLLHNIMTELTPYFSFSDECSWLYSGRDLYINDERSLSNNLSDIMFEIYPHTPEIRNEAFNRRSIAKVQEKNAYKVVDKILEKIQSPTADIEISGSGADYLIYATILKNNKLHTLLPTSITDESLIKLRQSLLKVIQNESGSFANLINIFSNSPFGVRKPVIPVLLPAILAKEWRYLLFYNNEMFMQVINGETLWKMVYEPNNYSFAYQKIDEKYNALISMVEDCFMAHIHEEDRGLLSPVYVSKVLLRWYNSLPRVARVTNKQSTSSYQLRQLIRVSEMRPVDALEQLNNLADQQDLPRMLESVRFECESYIEQHKQEIEKTLLNTMKHESYSQLRNWAENQSRIVKNKSKLVSAILSCDTENYVNAIAQAIVGVNRHDWSDATDEVFQTELLNELSAIQNSNSNKDYIEVINGGNSLVFSKVELSTKSRLIYDDIGRKLKYTGRTVTRDEILIVLWNLMKDISGVNDQEKINKTLEGEG